MWVFALCCGLNVIWWIGFGSVVNVVCRWFWGLEVLVSGLLWLCRVGFLG